MTLEEQQFEQVLEELAILMGQLGDLSDVVTIIGGQVLAIESRLLGGTGEVTFETETGLVVPRGFTLEPDLLFDLDGSEFMAERLIEVLTQRGYKRTRHHRWSKKLERGRIDLDLFAPEGVELEDLPTPMTPLHDARLVVRDRRPFTMKIGTTALNLARPSIAGFVAMKVRAKRELRPGQTKDSFDLAAYVSLLGSNVVLEALKAIPEGRKLEGHLVDLFGSISSPGVRDVVSYAGSYDAEAQQLLAQAVVDLFSDFYVYF